MDKICFAFLVAFLFVLPIAAADDKYFFINDNSGPYTALPGDEVIVGFILVNKDLVAPKDVKVFMDPCPVNWKCEEQRYSFDTKGNHELNLSVKIPDTALNKKYTMYLLLESDYPTTRGDDRLVFEVITPEQAKTVRFDEYEARKDALVKPELYWEGEASVPEKPVPELYEDAASAEAEQALTEEEETGSNSIVNEIVPDINRSEIVENVERLESSHQFVEYASVVLIVLLVFIAAGAIMTFRKNK